jgi:pyruvate dehydrogenase E2 component (dihydrolipoamide acetyltransferase)
MSSIKKLEDEAARTRQEVSQLKRRLAEMELSMATLNAKLHRALSKVAHMEADNAAAARASIERGGRSGGDMALTVWAERRAPSRPQLGHPLRLGEADREAVAAPARRKVQKQKPIVPLVVPLISGVLFSKKRRMKDKESVYMKELYSLLRLT